MHLHRRCGRTGDHPRGGGTRAAAWPRSPWRLPGRGGAARACSVCRSFANSAWRPGSGRSWIAQQLADEQQRCGQPRRDGCSMRRPARWASRSCSMWSAAIPHCSSPPHRRLATSSSSRSRGCRRKRLVHATAQWLEAAHACAASVMLVPQVLARRQGRWRRWSAPSRIPPCASRRASRRRRARAFCCSSGVNAELANGAAEQARAAGLASDGSSRAALPAWCRRMSCKVWVRAANAWSCWPAAPVVPTMQRYPRTLRRHVAFPCWSWSPE